MSEAPRCSRNKENCLHIFLGLKGFAIYRQMWTKNHDKWGVVVEEIDRGGDVTDVG